MRKPDLVGEIGKAAVALVFAAAAVGLIGTRSFAGDLSPLADDQSPNAAVLAQTNTTTTQTSESWLRDFHVSGFLNETDGMWLNPTNLKDFTPSRNNLATARTWLQVDENFRPDPHNQFFMREWFVYEPPYSFNSANNHVYNCTNFPALPCGNTPATRSDLTIRGAAMYRLNDFYNQYTVRDAWWRLSYGPVDLYLGNQIVVWGQSLAFRVGDVINPQDTTWNFGFANLEQSRTPQWMIHPIFNLPDFGPLTANFAEGVLIPGAQPMWNSVEYPDGRYDGEENIAGRVSNGLPAAEHYPSARFDSHSDTIAYPGRAIDVVGLNPNLGVYPMTVGSAVVPPPFTRFLYFCSQTQGLFAAFHIPNPTPKGLIRPCNLSPAPRVGVPNWSLPAVKWKNMEEGLRLHTLLGGSEVTALYFNTFQYLPAVGWVPYTSTFPFVFEPTQYVGATIDRPVPMPASLGETLPLVIRAEAVYANHVPFMNFSLTDTNSLKFSDTLTYMIALDLSQAYAPWLTKTGTLSANFEFFDNITLDGNNSMGPLPTTTETDLKNDVWMLFNFGTSWRWNVFAPNATWIYEPKGTTFALFPGFQVTPPWTDKYFGKIGLIYVLSSDKTYPLGFFKGQNFITGTLQYNFSAL
jgi:hypothetical protein